MEESNIKEYFYETNPLTKEIFSSIGDKVCLVGGAIVDCILGREPQDYDLSFFSQQALDDTIIYYRMVLIREDMIIIKLVVCLVLRISMIMKI